VEPIPDIQVQNVGVPNVQPHYLNIPSNLPYTIPVTLSIGTPIIDVPGCVEYNPANKNSLALSEEDSGKNVVLCDGTVPSFTPMDYTPENLIYVEKKEPPPVNNTPTDTPEPTSPGVPEIPNEGKKEEDPPCPGPNDQRVGDLRNAQAKEKVVGHEIRDGKCITLYEETTIVDQYVPTPAQVVNTAQIAVVAATVPILIQIVKPAVAQIIKRIPKLLGRKNKEILSTSQKLARQRLELQDQKKKNQIGQKRKKK
tara:strand:- start:1914 stop:2675 length:762 start_codon:yes stop_codon:yes gene_type:complete